MAKEKKPSYSDYIVMHFATVALRKSEPPFLFAFPTMLIQSGGRYIGGHCHVNCSRNISLSFSLSAALLSAFFLYQVLAIIEKDFFLRLFRQLSKSRRKEAAI